MCLEATATKQSLVFEAVPGSDCYRDTAEHSGSPMDYQSVSPIKKDSWESSVAECLPDMLEAQGYISRNKWVCIERNKKSDKECNLS